MGRRARRRTRPGAGGRARSSPGLDHRSQPQRGANPRRPGLELDLAVSATSACEASSARVANIREEATRLPPSWRA